MVKPFGEHLKATQPSLFEPLKTHVWGYIRNIEAFLNGFWDWAILDGCFPRPSIHATDVDGLVEINGRVLIIEAKRPGQPVDLGQKRTLRRYARDRYHTVLTIYGRPPAGPIKQASVNGNPPKSASIDAVRDYVTAWAAWADKEPPLIDYFCGNADCCDYERGVLAEATRCRCSACGAPMVRGETGEIAG